MSDIERVFVSPKIARDLHKLHLAACRVAYSSAITAGALRALLETGAEVVFYVPPGKGETGVKSCPQDIAIIGGCAEAEIRTLVSLSLQPPSSIYILETGMPYIHNFHIPEYPGCTPSWLETDPSQNRHLFKHSSKTGVRAAKRAAKKRRRNKP